jgi:DNA mismatch repair protein MSH2
LELARSKAAELEDFTAPEAAEGGAAAGACGKRKRVAADDATEGAARARRFLADFATLPLPQLSPTDAAEQVQQLCKGLEADAAGNPWLKQLLTRA